MNYNIRYDNKCIDIYRITWKYAYDTTVAEDPKFLILLNFDMILGLITHPISLTNCIGVRFPSWATQFRTIMSNFWSSSLIPRTYKSVKWVISLTRFGSIERINIRNPFCTVKAIFGTYHCHCLSDLNDSTNLTRPWPFAWLDLHPTLKVVTQKVCSYCIQHVHLKGSKCNRFFVVIVPCTPKFSGLIKNLLNQRIILW